MLMPSSYFSWARRKKVKVMNVEMEYLVGGRGEGMIGVFLRNIHVRVQYFYILDGSVTSSPTMIIFMLYICSIVISF